MSRCLALSTLLLPFALGGCGSKGSVGLSAQVQSASLAVESVTLGTKLSGSFELFLEVGPEASGGSDVGLLSFALVTASSQATLVAPLHLSPAESQYHVPKGEQRILPFELDHPDPLASALLDALCAEPVQISGAVTDSLSGGESTPVHSQSIAVRGCP